jgi:hypothetical protein
MREAPLAVLKVCRQCRRKAAHRILEPPPQVTLVEPKQIRSALSYKAMFRGELSQFDAPGVEKTNRGSPLSTLYFLFFYA